MLRLLIVPVLLLLSVSCLDAATVSSWSDYREAEKTLADDDAETRFAMALWQFRSKNQQEMERLLEEVIKLDPDHKQARRMLGHEQVDGKWLSGDELKIAQGLVQHKGEWVTKEAKEKLDQGLLEYKGKWLTQDEYYQKLGYKRHRGQWLDKSTYKKVTKREQQFRELTKQRADWSNAWEFETQFFKIKTNCPHQIAEEVAIAMDMCFLRLKDVFGLTKKIAKVPLEVYATQEQFMQGSAQAGIPVSMGTLGYFYWGGMESGIRCFYAGSIEQTLSTLFHECTHLVIRSVIGGEVPTWSNEGLAVFLEDAKREEDGIDLQAIPWSRVSHLRDQMERGKISLNTLVRNQNNYTVEYYPQGWSVIYFMLYFEDGKYRKNFMNYYELLKKQNFSDNIDAFRKAFGQQPDDFYDEWKSMIDALKPETTTDLIGAAMQEAKRELNYDKAIEYAQQVIDSDERSWEAKLAFGRVLMYRGLINDDRESFRSALEYFGEALKGSGHEELESKRGKSIYLPKLMHIDYARTAIGAGEYELAKGILEGILEVDPLSSQAYAFLALIAGTADDENFRSDELAGEYLDIADDLGQNHINLYVRAMWEWKRGNMSQVREWLEQGATQDRFGFGAHFYRRLIMRLQMGERDGVEIRKR